jgi:site-specific recombinase XerD
MNEFYVFLDEFLLEHARNMAPKTQSYYRSQLTGLFTWCIAEDVTVQSFRKLHLNRYIAERHRAGRSLKTQYDDCLTARIFFRWAASEKIIPYNPLERYELRKPPKPFVRMPSDSELKLLLSILEEKVTSRKSVNGLTKAQSRFVHLRNIAIFAILIDTGMRMGECLALNLQDSDIEKYQLYIRVSKGREPRIVPISMNLSRILNDYLKDRGKVNACGDALFIGITGERLTSSRLQRIFQTLRKTMQCSEPFTLHGLRHYAITQMAKVDILMAANSAGHKDLKVTQGYIHADADYLRATHDKANPLGRLLMPSRRAAARKRIL